MWDSRYAFDTLIVSSQERFLPSQILKVDHWRYVVGYIRSRIDQLDDNDAEEEEEDTQALGHVSLGSNQRPCTLRDLEECHSSDGRFQRFQAKLAIFFNRFLPAHNIPLPNGEPIKFAPSDSVRMSFAASACVAESMSGH